MDALVWGWIGTGLDVGRKARIEEGCRPWAMAMVGRRSVSVFGGR
jgi:hypothetical protein